MATVEALKSLKTAEQFAEMSFDTPAELIRGIVMELPMPDQIHGVVCGNTYYAITTWARPTGRGVATINDSHIVTERGPDTARGPDVCYFSRDRLPGGKLPRGVCEIVPNLCVEVMSLSDRWNAVHRKIDEFLARGVDEVWVVEPRTRVVHVFRQDDPPALYREQDELTSSVRPGFSCQVADLFQEA